MYCNMFCNYLKINVTLRVTNFTLSYFLNYFTEYEFLLGERKISNILLNLGILIKNLSLVQFKCEDAPLSIFISKNTLKEDLVFNEVGFFSFFQRQFHD